jgi:hypothetical protein
MNFDKDIFVLGMMSVKIKSKHTHVVEIKALVTVLYEKCPRSEDSFLFVDHWREKGLFLPFDVLFFRDEYWVPLSYFPF